jgi:hypothetical protein
MAGDRTLARQPSAPERRPVPPAVEPPRHAAVQPHAVQLLQRRLGNRGTASLMARQAATMQASSLTVSSAHDPAEREAGATAAAVMRMSPPSRHDPAPPAPPRPRSPVIARLDLHRGPDRGAAVEPRVASEIQSNMAGGAPLAPEVRGFMEPRFGADFKHVRVHTGEPSAELNRKVNARAFTVGEHVFFGKGAYQPETHEGRELIAHELTHTIQQGAVVQHDRQVQRAEHPVVTERSPARVQRFGIGAALDYIADKANLIPGFRMLTIILGMNPVNMSPVARTPANVLRALIEVMPGATLITQALDGAGVFDKVGAWIDEQVKSLGLTAAALKASLMDFLNSLSWGDVLDLGGVWDRAKRIFTAPVDRLITFAGNAVSAVVQFVKDAILMPIAKLAEGTRGWDLLIAVLGKNPITGAPVPRTAETLIPGFLKLIGKEEIWDNMVKAKAIPRAWAWFQHALTGIAALVNSIPTRFTAAFKSLELSDIILIPKAFAKIAGVFGNFILDFVTFAGNAVWTLLELIFEVVSPETLKYIKKTGAALKSILENPLPFAKNLVRAAVLGFQHFADNFGQHLKSGLIDWLTGSLPGVYIPKAFELGEIVKFVFSVLGISWQNVRQKLVAVIGETAVKVLETTFDIVVTLVKDGPAAAWEKIKEYLTNLKDMVISGITDFVVETIVKKAVPKLIAMFIPGAGFISAIVSIYDTVMVFVNKISQIIQVVTGFIDSIVEIAGGAIDSAAAKVEGTLARLLSLAINFLAGFLGLGKVADKVMEVIQKVRAVVDKGIDALIKWIVTAAKSLGKFVAGKAQALFSWAFAKQTFNDDAGTKHDFFVSEDGEELMIASTPQAAEAFVKFYVEKHPNKKDLGAQILKLIKEAKPIVTKINAAAKPKAPKSGDPPPAPPAPEEQKELLQRSIAICALLSKLISGDEKIGELDKKYLLEGQVATYATVPKAVHDQLTPDHQPQASIIQGAADFFRKKLKIKGGDIADRAESRAAAGWAINVHFNRHIKGATYGSKGETREGFAKRMANEIPDLGDDTAARKHVSQALKDALSKDVKAMKDVVNTDVENEAWKDLKLKEDGNTERPAAERKKFKNQITQQINAGEDQIHAQPLDF